MKILPIYMNVIEKIKYFSNESGAGCWYRKESAKRVILNRGYTPEGFADNLFRNIQKKQNFYMKIDIDIARIQKYQNPFMCIMDFGRKGKECKPYTITPAFESMLFLERENDIADYGK